MSVSRVQYLFQQWFNRIETSEEYAELILLLEKSEHDPELKNALEEIWKDFKPEMEEMDPQMAEGIYDNIIKAKQGRLRHMPGRFLKIAAAALIAGLIGVCVFIFRNPTQQAVIVKQSGTVVHDITPGSQKAVLTLADGSVITLDSTGNQVITAGKTTIHRQGGQLQYDASGKEAPVWNKLSTPRGGQFRIVLPDNSRVWLNAASSIRYPTAFTKNERRVEVTGEVYFEITRDAAMPFRVNVNNRSVVEVLGTSFNVNAYEDESLIKTSLLEGKVKIFSQGEQAKELRPGQQAQLSATGNIQISDDIDLAEVMAWKEGWFQFNQATIADVMRQLSRWYDIEISFKGALPNRIFEGRIQRNLTLNQVMNILDKNGIHSQLEDRKLILIP